MKCIKQKNSFAIVKSLGMTYSQIAMSIQKLLEDGYLEYDDDDTIILTELGSNSVNDYDKNSDDREQKWIHPQYSKYSAPLDPSIIIIPKRLK
ncbi:hypothetical protein [Ruminococcus albus]|uniref:hypothetical protein n=1 Tax=Ruminococcus albus TaxID=1264 RepID=UPI001113C039|nr:hypothetical protein [Ruminococcus albus]